MAADAKTRADPDGTGTWVRAGAAGPQAEPAAAERQAELGGAERQARAAGSGRTGEVSCWRTTDRNR